MEKSVLANDYLMVFTGEDIVQQKHNDGNPIFYCGQAEEFARRYFSDTKNGRKMDDAKIWLLGILYHERKNSLPKIKDITGYRSVGTLSDVIKRSGKLRGISEATNLACQKKYGKSLTQFSRERMKNIWEHDDGSFRDRISRTASEGMHRVWDNDKDGTFRDKIRKTASLGMKNYLEGMKTAKAI